MINKTKIAFSVAIILSAASAALAGQDDRNDRGGFVMPGSMDGVNPAYHLGWFPHYAVPNGNAGNDYGYVASPNWKHRSSRK